MRLRLLWMGVVGALGVTASCLSVGSTPEVDAVSDVIEDTSSEACLEASLLDFRCTDDGSQVEVCTDQGWLLAQTCSEDSACYDSPLEATAACLPRFDCYNVVVHYLSCDFGGLGLTDQVLCKGACLSHAESDDYEPLVNCYDTAGCDDVDDPFTCVSDNCEQSLLSCLSDDDDRKAPPPDPMNNVFCADLAECHRLCPTECGDTCGVHAPGSEEEGSEEESTCLASCGATCTSTCREQATPQMLALFLEWDACMVAECGGLDAAAQSDCMWSRCGVLSLACLQDSMVQGGGTPESVCRSAADCVLDSTSGTVNDMMGCLLMVPHHQHEAVFELMGCVARASESGGQCDAEAREASASEQAEQALNSCLATACADALEACP